MSNKRELRIYGAGIAGLLAGNIFQQAKIYEAGDASQAQHKAVLRFRSDAVGKAVGIDFRKVTVHKGLWYEGEFVSPNIQLANFYSAKVIGRLADRSIWNLQPVERYIAPEDFVAQLAERCGDRVQWNTPLMADDIFGAPPEVDAISTLPMSVVAQMFNNRYFVDPTTDTIAPSFHYAPIVVKRGRVLGDCDVFQTVYFPSRNTTMYRATITGDLLIVEFMGEPESQNWKLDVGKAFGLLQSSIEWTESAKQRFGKIAPIDDAWRRHFQLRLSLEHRIFSLGRFGTWRNLLLDDVLQDIGVIKRLMNSTRYDQIKLNALS